MRLEVSRKIKKMVTGSITLFKRAVWAYHVFMQLCIKLIIMEESQRKFSNQSSLVQECNGLVSIHLVSTLLHFKGQKSLEPPRKIIKCGGVSYLETLSNALGVRPEKPGQSKESLYNLSDSLRG
jgi:hypothetical protein